MTTAQQGKQDARRRQQEDDAQIFGFGLLDCGTRVACKQCGKTYALRNTGRLITHCAAHQRSRPGGHDHGPTQ